MTEPAPETAESAFEEQPHKHQVISPIIIRSSTSNPFASSSHSIQDLRSCITTHAQTRNPHQQGALNIFFTSKGANQHSAYTLALYSRFSDAEIVESYFHLFDSLFFFSSLKERCQVELVARTGEGLNNWTIKSARNVEGEVRSKISVHVLAEVGKTGRNERLRAYLGIVLHEMIHIFLFTYACPADSSTKLLHGTSRLGHGDAWQDIAFEIEIATKHLLGLEVDLLRKWCLVTELCLNGEPVHSIRVEKWGFDGEEIEYLVTECGKDVRREARIGVEFVQWARGWVEKLRGRESSSE